MQMPGALASKWSVVVAVGVAMGSTLFQGVGDNQDPAPGCLLPLVLLLVCSSSQSFNP